MCLLTVLSSKQYAQTLHREKPHLISLTQTGGVNSVAIGLRVSASCVIWTVN